MGDLRILDIVQELGRERRESGLFTVEVISIQEMPPLPPSIGPDFGVMPRMFLLPSARAGEAE